LGKSALSHSKEKGGILREGGGGPGEKDSDLSRGGSTGFAGKSDGREDGCRKKGDEKPE